MSNLLEHAEREMRLAGLYDEGADYGGMIPKAVMNLIHPFAAEGHSGISAELVVEIFQRLARFKTLTPPTNDPAEWQQIDPEMMPKGEHPCWQSLRQPDLFSHDGGKTYRSVDDKD